MWKKGSHLRVRGKGLCLTHFKNHGSMEPLIILYVTFSLSRCIPSAATSQLKALVLLPSSIIILCGDLPALFQHPELLYISIRRQKTFKNYLSFPFKKGDKSQASETPYSSGNPARYNYITKAKWRL